MIGIGPIEDAQSDDDAGRITVRCTEGSFLSGKNILEEILLFTGTDEKKARKTLRSFASAGGLLKSEINGADQKTLVPLLKGRIVGLQWPDGDLETRYILSEDEARKRLKKEAAEASSKGGDEEKPKPKLADQIIALVEEKAELFHDAKGDTFAAAPNAKGVSQTMRIDTPKFRAWIAFVSRKETGCSVGPSTIDEARLALHGTALYDAPEKPVHVRVAEHDGAIYLDLGDETGECVECKSDGWEIVESAPVQFIRPSGMRPLPRPVRGGHVDDLRPFVNVRGTDFYLLLAWLVGAFRPGRPSPIAAIQGEQSTAKTTCARVMRKCIDPNVADVRTPPRNEDDLMVMAHNCLVPSLDNLSGMKPWLSDALCRIATGGGLSKRAHYANADEVIVEALRPMILNGIDDIASRADLGERSIVFTLEPLKKRRDEKTFWKDFDEALPRILGALLDAVCCALRNIDSVQLADPPRMADFARWATAAEPALGLKHGTIVKAYRENLAGASTVALEASPVAVAVRAMMATCDKWSGTAEELLNSLTEHASEEALRSPYWPTDGARLSNRLRRVTVPLRMAAGIEVRFRRKGSGKRVRRQIVLRRCP